MLEFGNPPGHARRLASDDPDEVTSWVARPDGHHSRVVYGTGPYGYVLDVVEGRQFRAGWGGVGQPSTVWARFEALTLHMPLDVPQRYRYGRQQLTAGQGTIVACGAGVDAARDCPAGQMFALRVEDAVVADELRARLGERAATLPSFPTLLPHAASVQRELGLALQAWMIATAPAAAEAALLHDEARLLGVLADLFSAHRRGAGRRGATARRLADLECWIEAHLAEPLTIGRLCEVADVRERALQIGFLARRGMSPLRYVHERRLAAAQRRLASDDAPDITSVATSLGFTHLGRFSVAYRATFGESPSQTRARHAPAAARTRAAPGQGQRIIDPSARTP